MLSKLSICIGLVFVFQLAATSARKLCSLEFETTREEELYNKGVVLSLLQESFVVPNGNFTEVSRKYIVSNYIQHNPFVPDGREETARGIASLYPGLKAEYIVNAAADEDFVWVHVIYSLPGGNYISKVEIFRLECGWIAEHWDVAENFDFSSAFANTHPYF